MDARNHANDRFISFKQKTANGPNIPAQCRHISLPNPFWSFDPGSNDLWVAQMNRGEIARSQTIRLLNPRVWDNESCEAHVMNPWIFKVFAGRGLLSAYRLIYSSTSVFFIWHFVSVFIFSFLSIYWFLHTNLKLFRCSSSHHVYTNPDPPPY